MLKKIRGICLQFIAIAGSLAMAPALCQADHVPGTVEGAWSLQFRLNSDFTLSDFSGTLISLQHQYSRQSALRAGVTLSFRSAEIDDRFVSGDTIDVALSFDQDESVLGIIVQYLRYSSPARRISAYWAAGPEVVFWNNSREGVQPFSRKAGFFGVRGSLGVEWSPIPEIGLHTEYGARGGYSYSRDEIAGIGQRWVDRDGWEIGGQSVLLGLSAYF